MAILDPDYIVLWIAKVLNIVSADFNVKINKESHQYLMCSVNDCVGGEEEPLEAVADVVGIPHP